MTPTNHKILYDLAVSLLHTPYIYGGANPSFGLDCSGMVIELLQSVGVLEHRYDATAAMLYANKLFDRCDTPEFGDLVFFGATAKTITHVAFCMGPKLMLEAGGGHANTLQRAMAYQQNARVRIRPIENRRDLVGYKRPPYG